MQPQSASLFLPQLEACGCQRGGWCCALHHSRCTRCLPLLQVLRERIQELEEELEEMKEEQLAKVPPPPHRRPAVFGAENKENL